MQKTIASVWIFRSESSPNKTYQTMQYVDGSTSCECPGWRFKKKTLPNGDRTCKHTRDFDLGTADMHAEKKVEYGRAGKRAPQQTLQVPVQPTMGFQTNRRITIED